MFKVLVVSRYFPPLSSAGSSIRLVKLIKNAAEQGWAFSVITQHLDRTVIQEDKSSEFLLKEIPQGTDIFRIGSPLGRSGNPSPRKPKSTNRSSLPWGAAVIWKAWQKYHHLAPDLLFVNSPPFTNIAIGFILAAWFKTPLVLDIKDDWVGSAAYWKKGRLRRFIEQKIEQGVVQKADAIITVTQESFETIQSRYPNIRAKRKIFLIPNGVDTDEFKPIWKRNRKIEGRRFQILSAAAGYHPGYRDLTPLITALELLFKRCPLAQGNIEIIFLGEDPDIKYKQRIENIFSKDCIHYRGVVDRKELVESLWQADLFFHVQPANNSTAISGTLYEYWAVGKAPVLLFSESGASRNFVLRNHLGSHFHFSQTKEAAQYVEEIYQAFCSHRPIWISQSGVEEYDRRRLADQTIALWKNVLQEKGKVK